MSIISPYSLLSQGIFNRNVQTRWQKVIDDYLERHQNFSIDYRRKGVLMAPKVCKRIKDQNKIFCWLQKSNFLVLGTFQRFEIFQIFPLWWIWLKTRQWYAWEWFKHGRLSTFVVVDKTKKRKQRTKVLCCNHTLLPIILSVFEMMPCTRDGAILKCASKSSMESRSIAVYNLLPYSGWNWNRAWDQLNLTSGGLAYYIVSWVSWRSALFHMCLHSRISEKLL